MPFPHLCDLLLGLFVGVETLLCIFKLSRRTHFFITLLSFCLITILFFSCVTVHLVVDLQFLHVFENNHPKQIWYYRLASLWSHHETSLFVWLYLLNAVAIFIRFKGKAAYSLHALNCFLGLFMMVDANPFAMTHEVMLHTQKPAGLNPLLHDLNMVWHPPLLYLGQVLLFLPYANGVFESQTDKKTLRLAMAVLTLAVALGALWAFTQLGWGGFWFWDPVETVSLLPWFAGLTLLHTPSTLRTQMPWMQGLPFCFVMLSMWLVRSGVLNSVHSFAANASAFWALGMLTLVCFLSLVRPKKIVIKKIVDFHVLYQKPFLSVGLGGMIFVLLILCVGAITPLLFHNSVTPAFYNTVFLPIFILFCICLFFHIYPPSVILRTINVGVVLSLAAAGCVLYTYHFNHLLFLILAIFGASACSAMIPYLFKKPKMALGHMGLGLILFALANFGQSPAEQTIPIPLEEQTAPLKDKSFVIQNHGMILSRDTLYDTQQLHVSLHHADDHIELYPKRLFFHNVKEYRPQASFSFKHGILYMITTFEQDPHSGVIYITYHEKYGLLWLCVGILLLLFSFLSPKCYRITFM